MRKFFIPFVFLISLQTAFCQQPPVSVTVAQYTIKLKGDLKFFEATLNSKNLHQGVDVVSLKIKTKGKAFPPKLSLVFEHPAKDIQGIWHAGAQTDKIGMYAFHRDKGLYSSGTFNAPVFAMYNNSGSNSLTFAVSEIMNPVFMNAGIDERSVNMNCEVVLFSVPSSPISEAEVLLYLDTRSIPFYKCLDHVQQWWLTTHQITPNVVPEYAKLPLYSTWYSFHQEVNARELDTELVLAAKMGCKVVINDDGWQTDLSEGNDFYGDWLPAADKFPDLAGHVEKTHQLGMKYMMWIAVPFVGKKSQAYKKYQDKLLYYVPWAKSWVLDIRFPEIREHLISTCENMMTDYNLDGLKVDFVDRFNSNDPDTLIYGNGRDINSVEIAADTLLTQLVRRLKKIKPDALIEFRQNYTGPLMRKYGNMLRAMDCSYAAIENKYRTIDIRLLSGKTAVHSDMLLWNYKESVEAAALQIENVLFSVPQISVRPSLCTEEHNKMTSFLLKFWTDNRDAFIDGELIPFNPELNYPVVKAATADKEIAVLYASSSKVELSNKKFLAVVNANYGSEVTIVLKNAVGNKKIKVYSCTGDLISQNQAPINKGITSYAVPPCGIITFE